MAPLRCQVHFIALPLLEDAVKADEPGRDNTAFVDARDLMRGTYTEEAINSLNRDVSAMCPNMQPIKNVKGITMPKVALNVCARPGCGKVKSPECPLKQCARCRTVAYCSATCQREHWKRHKKACAKIASEGAP